MIIIIRFGLTYSGCHLHDVTNSRMLTLKLFLCEQERKVSDGEREREREREREKGMQTHKHVLPTSSEVGLQEDPKSLVELWQVHL